MKNNKVLASVTRQPIAFTLVELLVVVAIIAILMAVLLPAMKKARSVAKQAVCMTRQREVCSAEFLYESDYSRLAYNGTLANQYLAALWSYRGLYPYLNIDTTNTSSTNQPSTTSREKSPLFCPDAPAKWKVTSSGSVGYGSTSYPRVITEYYDLTTTNPYPGSVTSAKVQSPAGIVFHFEGWEAWATSGVTYSGYFGVAFNNWLTSYHGLLPTKSYFDGHVESHLAGCEFVSYDGSAATYVLPPGFATKEQFSLTPDESPWRVFAK